MGIPLFIIHLRLGFSLTKTIQRTWGTPHDYVNPQEDRRTPSCRQDFQKAIDAGARCAVGLGHDPAGGFFGGKNPKKCMRTGGTPMTSETSQKVCGKNSWVYQGGKASMCILLWRLFICVGATLILMGKIMIDQSSPMKFVVLHFSANPSPIPQSY